MEKCGNGHFYGSETGITPDFDSKPTSEAIRALAYDEMQLDSTAKTQALQGWVNRLHELTLSDPSIAESVLKDLTITDRLRTMPVADIALGTGGGLESITFHPGCLDTKSTRELKLEPHFVTH